MTRSFGKTYGLRAKDKSKMAMKRGFDNEDEEEVTERAHPKNLKEAAHADKITKEAWAKVMAHRKAAALTAAPGAGTVSTLGPETATGPTCAPETAPTLTPVPAIH